MNRLIINTEFFLQCYGNCVGCFLTEIEKKEQDTNLIKVKSGLSQLAKDYKNTNIEHLVIGFGRGNLLNLDVKNLDNLLELIGWCESNFNYKDITFEISTSLIGKLENQIEKAIYLLNGNSNIFFNIVINSEITSMQFWKNLNIFYQETSKFRINKYEFTEDYGDIIVLNVNPNNLPNIDFIYDFTTEYGSPLNISIFPFELQDTNINQLQNVIDWSSELWEKLKYKDLNIKNYLNNLKEINIGESIQEILNYQNITEKSYYFIDKNGLITNGSLSIMGEVDKLRLLTKYNIKLDILTAYKAMQKNNVCAICEYQKECLLSGAYLNMLANKIQIKDNIVCLSGYQKLFELAKK
jgi:hypothetical protein